MTTTISKSEAEALFVRFGELLQQTEAVIDEIVRTRAWEALGYSSFAEAYREKLGHIPIRGKHVKNRVIVALALDDCLSDEELGEPRDYDHSIQQYVGRGWARWSTISGEHIADAREQIIAGVPADEIVVQKIGSWPISRQTYRHLFNGETIFRPKSPVPEDGKTFRKSTFASPPSEPRFLRIEFTPEEFARLHRVAQASGRSLHQEAKRAVTARIDRLEADLKLSV